MVPDPFKSCVLALSAFLSLTGCGSDADEPTARPFELEFAATAAGRRVGCADSISSVGPSGAYTVGISDLRFYVSNLKLWDDKQQEVQLTLDENDFQHASAAGQVSLVDLTSNTEGSCSSSAIAFSEGTKRTNAAITGKTVIERVKSVSFDVGVPQAVMQDVIASHTPEGAPSPLAEMQWTWATGYRHFVLNFTVADADGAQGDGYAHLGSRNCGPADGLALEDRDRCEFVNTPQVSLGHFDLDSNVVSVDIPRILGDLDFESPIYDLDTFEVIGKGPGVECHSSPAQPDCPALFANFGMDIATGEAKASQDVAFGVE